MDAAHNPHGARAIAETLEAEFTFDEIIGIFAAFADKDVEGILFELEPVLSSIIVTASTSTRAMPVSEVERIASRIFGADRVIKVEYLEDAIKRAITDARRPLSDDSIGIVITGSVVTVGQARAILKRLSRE